METSRQKEGNKPSVPVISEKNDNFDFYIGWNAGKRMYGRLYDTKKSIKVISPFLNIRMIEELDKRSREGIKDIFLITSFVENANKVHVEAVKALFNKVRDEFRPAFNTVFFKGTRLHEKLYIIDDEIVYAGSFNFTGSGINENLESVITFKKPEMVQKVIEYFDRLFKTTAIEKWEPAELGKLVYSIQQ